MLKNLWNDEGGAVVSAEIVLIGTILVIGMVVGLSALRDAVVTELADVGAAIGNLNQSYSYSSAAGHGSFSAGSFLNDQLDHCDLICGDIAGGNARCVTICVTPGTHEGGTTF